MEYRFSIVFSVINYCWDKGVRISDYEQFDKVYTKTRIWVIIFEALQFIEVGNRLILGGASHPGLLYFETAYFHEHNSFECSCMVHPRVDR